MATWPQKHLILASHFFIMTNGLNDNSLTSEGDEVACYEAVVSD